MMNILVTGCSRGIGLSIVEKLLNEQHSVTGVIRTETEEIQKLISKYDKFDILKADFADNISVEQICRDNIQKKTFDVIINNAGMAQRRPFLELSMDDWYNIFQVNFFSAVQLTKSVLPRMLEQKKGTVINISSVGGQWGGQHQVHYAATKASLINFTKSLTKTYAANGIYSFSIAPGIIDTDMIIPEMPSDEQGLAELLKTIPVKRLGTKSDVADLVSFLVNSTPVYMAGSTFNLNGGVYLG